ncbi:MAG TPA: ABC transporter substrate-binding protein [Candidatus Limivivens intestinipullorum]|uniref:ABC transporter substrate-binding protein n=1 Tax=Candidatus Limivivens intestinipullorum TaxID=2840858 RepID=A0A9D1JKR2_9FIRM|nr:ABC transporter substrate-binding protein [Candidatus Limivivens intestinipullorum]
MKTRKKVLSMLLAGAMLLTGFSGFAMTGSCEESAALEYNGQDVSEPVELVCYYIGDKAADQDLVLEKVNEILKEKINATLVLKNLSLSDYTTKYSLTIAGGEAVDLMYTSTWAYYQSEANKGAFAEITDEVLENYMPLHKEYQSEASWGQAKIGDHIYFVPVNMANVNANAMLIRGDLREKYGLDELESPEDLAAYMQAVADDPDSGVSFAYNASQNNDTSKKILLFDQNDWVSMEGSLLNYFSYEYSEDVSAEDLFWIYGTEEYLEYAKTMKEWADAGYWSKSSIANATDTKDAFLNGTSAVYFQNLGTVGATASQAAADHPEWQPEIYDLTPEANRFYGAYTGDGMAVLANSQNQERAFMALDLLKYDEELYNLVRHGIEGVHYEVDENNMWLPAADQDKYPFGTGFSWGFKNNDYEMDRADTFADQLEIAGKWNEIAVEGPTAAFSFDDTNVANELSNLQSIYTQYVPLLDLGLVDDVEATLEEFNKQAENAGIQKVMDEAKLQLEEYFESVE